MVVIVNSDIETIFNFIVIIMAVTPIANSKAGLTIMSFMEKVM